MPANIIADIVIPAQAVMNGSTRVSNANGAVVLVCGKYIGNLNAGALYVYQGGVVEGDINVNEMHTQGRTNGRVRVHRLLVAGEHASVDELIRMPSFSFIDPNAHVNLSQSQQNNGVAGHITPIHHSSSRPGYEKR